MENIDDRYLIPFTLGSELTTESFRLAQNDNTYMLAAPRYYQFYASFARPRIAMYRGWIQNFHNLEYGVIPSLFLQKIGKGITSTLFNKPFILNSKDPTTNAITESKYKKSNFENGVKEAYDFAIEGGTGLIKWNKDGLGNLRLESVPMDKFFIQVDAYGDIESVKSFLASYHDTTRANYEYYLCEERFFRYVYKNGERKRYPFVHYLVYKTSSNITNEYTPKPTDAITYTDIPYDIRQLLKRDYGDIWLDTLDGEMLQDYSNCKLLPFDDDLGCRLLKFTRGIPAYPKLPFGQPIADLLMNESYAYDQLKFFERLELPFMIVFQVKVMTKSQKVCNLNLGVMQYLNKSKIYLTTLHFRSICLPQPLHLGYQTEPRKRQLLRLNTREQKRAHLYQINLN